VCTCDALRACGGSGGWEVGWGWATGKLACLLETGFSICWSAAMVLPAPGGARGDLCGAAVMSSEQERLERLERQERQERLAVQSRHVCPNASTHMTDQPLRPPCIHVYKRIHTRGGGGKGPEPMSRRAAAARARRRWRAVTPLYLSSNLSCPAADGTRCNSG